MWVLIYESQFPHPLSILKCLWWWWMWVRWMLVLLADCDKEVKLLYFTYILYIVQTDA
jgi:hypothetical protein